MGPSLGLKKRRNVLYFPQRKKKKRKKKTCPPGTQARQLAECSDWSEKLTVLDSSIKAQQSCYTSFKNNELRILKSEYPGLQFEP